MTSRLHLKMHSATCRTKNGYVFCADDEICCPSGVYEVCCLENEENPEWVPRVFIIFLIVFVVLFLGSGAVLIIRCLCFSKNQQGRVTGLPRRHSINNRTHPAVHVHPHRDIVPPAGNTRRPVPGGQVFVSPPPPYPTQQPFTHGVGHSTDYNQTPLNPSARGLPPHGPPVHVPQGSTTHPQHGHGNVPPPFEYIPPGSVLYK